MQGFAIQNIRRIDAGSEGKGHIAILIEAEIRQNRRDNFSARSVIDGRTEDVRLESYVAETICLTLHGNESRAARSRRRRVREATERYILRSERCDNIEYLRYSQVAREELPRSIYFIIRPLKLTDESRVELILIGCESLIVLGSEIGQMFLEDDDKAGTRERKNKNENGKRREKAD